MQATLARFMRRTNTSTPSTTVEETDSDDEDDNGSKDETLQGSRGGRL